jgi:HSP20 family protein
MAMTDPFAELERLRRELDRTMGQFGTRPRQRFAFLPGRGARQYPLVNVYDDGDAFQIEALAPGVDPEKLDVSIVRNSVTISGEKVGTPNIPAERVHRVERAAGRFVRTFDLPVDVDAERVEADYQNGLLRLRLPRAEAARPKRVEIRSA